MKNTIKKCSVVFALMFVLTVTSFQNPVFSNTETVNAAWYNDYNAYVKQYHTASLYSTPGGTVKCTLAAGTTIYAYKSNTKTYAGYKYYYARFYASATSTYYGYVRASLITFV